MLPYDAGDVLCIRKRIHIVMPSQCHIKVPRVRSMYILEPLEFGIRLAEFNKAYQSDTFNASLSHAASLPMYRHCLLQTHCLTQILHADAERARFNGKDDVCVKYRGKRQQGQVITS